MQILTSEQMHELDKLTMQHENITSFELMERAAREIFQFIQSHRVFRQTKIVVFAGPGGNGGDALAVSRMLLEHDYDVKTYLFNTTGHLHEDCAVNRDLLRKVATEEQFVEVTQQFDTPQLTKDMLIIDGLFGIGLNRPLVGGFASLVKVINASPATVISIDIPSGLMSENNSSNVMAHIVKADYTLTFQKPKLCMLLDDCQQYLGKISVIDIGLRDDAESGLVSLYHLLQSDEVASYIKTRIPFGHKGTFGHGMLIAGKYGMAGAVIFAAKAALHTGLGKLTIHTPHRNNDILQISVPEAIISHDVSDDRFSQAVPVTDFDACAIGPGLGTHYDTALAFIEQVHHCDVPLVIDADGLNIIGEHRGWLRQVPEGTILTPHPVEFLRIGNNGENSYQRLVEARKLAMENKYYVILKGHHTAICLPTGEVYFNTTGNSGMATAGSGDVLTGILLGYLAQGYSQAEASLCSVYLHGMAGELASEELTEFGVTASDIIRFLPKAFKKLVTKQDSLEPSENIFEL